MTNFGNTAFKRMVELKWSGLWSNMTGVLIRRKNVDIDTYKEKTM
jgi:hypothetical protein